jgi:hypothetical protein
MGTDSGWMVGCMYGWMDIWKDSRIERWMNGQLLDRMYEWMDGWMDSTDG